MLVAAISVLGVGIAVPLDHHDSVVSVNACCCICPINRIEKSNTKGYIDNMNKLLLKILIF
jgi:hypothetical protein